MAEKKMAAPRLGQNDHAVFSSSASAARSAYQCLSSGR